MNATVVFLLAGLAVGAAAGWLYFTGLRLGIGWALGSRQPGLRLWLSFAVRTGLLLALAYGLTRLPQAHWTLGGFLTGFILLRLLAVQRRSTPDGIRQ